MSVAENDTYQPRNAVADKKPIHPPTASATSAKKTYLSTILVEPYPSVFRQAICERSSSISRIMDDNTTRSVTAIKITIKIFPIPRTLSALAIIDLKL